MANRHTRAIPESSADEREEPERRMRRPKTSQAPALRRRGKRCRGGGTVGHDAGHDRQNGIVGLSQPGATACSASPGPVRRAGLATRTWSPSSR